MLNTTTGQGLALIDKGVGHSNEIALLRIVNPAREALKANEKNSSDNDSCVDLLSPTK